MPFKTAVLRLGALVILVLFALIGSSHGAKGKPDGCPHGPRPSTPSFEGCEQHFAGGKPPAFESAQHLVELCHSGWYASLYDTALKTPVYSAYYITPDKAAKGLENKFPRPGWAHTSAISATSQAACMNNLWNGNLGKKRTHDRGHLCPKDIMEYDREAADATFDMTNVVPQLRSCNSPTWAKVEHSIATHIAKNNAMYIVTGATDGGEAPSITKEGVHVPKYIFTAFCDPTSGGSAGFLGLTAEEHCGGDAAEGLKPIKVADIEKKLGTSIFDSKLCNTASSWSDFESKPMSSPRGREDDDDESGDDGDGSNSNDGDDSNHDEV